MLLVAGIAGCSAQDDVVADPTTEVAKPATTSTSATSTQAVPQLVSVDANRFEYRPGMYGWVSPSRNISCGIQMYDSGNTVFGCQARQAPLPAVHGNHDQMASEGPEHDPCMWPNPSVGVLFEHGVPRHICYHQGTFSLEPAVADRSVLEYGETIRVGDMLCTSEQAGMRCHQGERGFFLSRESVVIY